MASNLAVVLLSGGMDSCVTAAIAARTLDLALMHVNYRQRTEARELRAFSDVADFYHVPAGRRMIVDVDHLRRIGGSALTDPSITVPEADLGRHGVPPSYVPFRNANMLCMAVSWAEVIGAGKIFIGAVEDDSSGYPDCRQVFYDAFNRLIAAGTKPETHVEVVTPLIRLRKSEIVRRGIELGAPFELTWSCYQAEERACGRCDSCALRLRGFREAGYDDPIPYESH